MVFVAGAGGKAPYLWRIVVRSPRSRQSQVGAPNIRSRLHRTVASDRR
jgi:hypothetical protein